MCGVQLDVCVCAMTNMSSAVSLHGRARGGAGHRLCPSVPLSLGTGARRSGGQQEDEEDEEEPKPRRPRRTTPTQR